MDTNIQQSLVAISPPMILMLVGMVVLLADLGATSSARRRTALLALNLIGCAIAAVAAAYNLSAGDQVAFGGGMIADRFGNLFVIVLAIVATLSVLMSDRYLEEKHIDQGEYYALLLFSTSGAMIMAMSRDLVNVFIGLEVLSVALYILSGLVRREARSEESAVKYFLLGAFASGFLLFGTALVYGAVGLALRGVSSPAVTLPADASFTNFETIKTAITAAPELVMSPLFIAGVALVVVGLGFKAAIVPFHVWTPDVYEGAPTSVTAFMSAAAKAGAFAAFIRLVESLNLGQGTFNTVLWVLAAATMVVGNVLAVRQSNIKRMLAYSSIAHAGYIMVGILAAAQIAQRAAGGETLDLVQVRSAIIYYMLAYTFMNLGAFAVVIWLTRGGQEYTQISDYRGLAREQPFAAAVMAIFMVSLAGIPPAAGFFGKLYLFLASIKAGLVGLAILGLLVSVIGVFYYLNIIVQMYFSAPERDFAGGTAGGAKSAAVIAAAATLLLGVFASALPGLSPQPGSARTAASVPAATETPVAAPEPETTPASDTPAPAPPAEPAHEAH